MTNVTGDGKRFLMVVEEELPETTPQIHIVLDWLADLEQKMAGAYRSARDSRGLY